MSDRVNLTIALAGAVTGFAVILAGVDSNDTGEPWPRPVAEAHASTELLGLADPADSRRGSAVTVELGSTSLNRAASGAKSRLAALQSIATLADTPGAHADAALAAVALGDADEAVREEASHALGQRGGAVALGALQQAALDRSSRVRHEAVAALATIGTPEARRILSSLLVSDDASLRIRLVDALGELAGPEAAQDLEPLRVDANKNVRDAVEQWLDER
jgi:HEAT repeat protein